MKLPPEVKRAMERVELDLKTWSPWDGFPQSIPDLLEELRRFEREWAELVLLSSGKLALYLPRHYSPTAWKTLNAIGSESGKATTEELRPGVGPLFKGTMQR